MEEKQIIEYESLCLSLTGQCSREEKGWCESSGASFTSAPARHLQMGGGVSRVLRVGGAANNVCRFSGWRGVDKVTQGANLTKCPQPPSLPWYPSTSIHDPAGFAFPGRRVLAVRARPLLPVPSWGFLHAGRRAKSEGEFVTQWSQLEWI